MAEGLKGIHVDHCRNKLEVALTLLIHPSLQVPVAHIMGDRRYPKPHDVVVTLGGGTTVQPLGCPRAIAVDGGRRGKGGGGGEVPGGDGAEPLLQPGSCKGSGDVPV